MLTLLPYSEIVKQEAVLLWAVRAKSINCIKGLIPITSNLDPRDINGNGIFYGAHWNDYEWIYLALDYGAKPLVERDPQ